ncbi:PLP-dependent transferase [Ramlibacter tataouinensis]|uniref:Cystathionine beta-lyase (Beta-cystathionase)-like protein n=1 Tax=Ramlibacter tataouinensis (strain ATCC BAA-407 / DSM 14655 / LMG 21543 / TTB310) TaxID=365046 RepID=F5XX55_RAMTT|nr:PLP-dependent transferase [Ramlibacter tataouinensis]AEG92999.1 Cystathionine beta-lyase (Beta-cystathionase)-like protein [Ramlibacter tataouinensis TTB310]
MSDPVTHLLHHPYQPPAGFAAPQPGVFKASTVIFPNVAAMRARDWKHKHGYTYGLHGTPTTFLLEERIAALEGGAQCVLVPSGLAAVANVDLALLKTGDEVLIPANAYGPSKALAEGELANWGITHQLYDPMDPADLAARLGPRTRLVWLEAPGSVTMEFPPLAQLAHACRQRGVTTALDNTWGAGLAFNGFDLATPGSGADIVVQALTKYPSGGGDVLMGSIVTRDEALHLQLKLTHMRLGWGVGANDAEAVLRSLPSIALRYQAHDRAARVLARWLQARPEVARVLHPALEGSPGHEHWRALCTDPGQGGGGRAAGLFSVVFHERYRMAQVDAFCDRLRLFKLGYSWGGPVSLVVPYDMPGMRRHWPHRGTLVRFSVGLEAAADLQADLAQALDALAKT